LLLLPTIPTIREDTVAKKKPNITIRIAPRIVTGISGISQIAIVTTTIPIAIAFISISCSVRSLPVFLSPFIPLIASENVFTISGNDLIRLIIPPVATAPAPIYLM